MDRNGNKQSFKLTSLTIAALYGAFEDKSRTNISSEISLVKKEAKKINGSSLVIKDLKNLSICQIRNNLLEYTLSKSC
ncbi:hypothetical protein SH2C18_33470 [Clostridium sediminicola]